MPTKKKPVKKKATKKSGGKISVTLARLASPLRVRKVKAGTSIKAFLSANDINYSRVVKVNGRSVTATYTLKQGDIITSSTNVQGGKY